MIKYLLILKKCEEMKTKVFNVIILDKSGSMSSIARQAVDGVNETIGSIKSAQEKNPDQEHMVTLVAFCGCELKSIYHNVPVTQVRPLTEKDYNPCCMTPLLDAVGSTITRVHALKSSEENSLAIVTVITDGYENASHEFSLQALRSLIEAYKEQGWQFTYIGADHDVEQVAFSLSIQHTMKFDKTAEGTRAMFAKQNASRSKWNDKMAAIMKDPCMSVEERARRVKEANSEGYFD